MVRKVPISFELFGNTYWVVYDTIKTNSDSVFGEVDYISNTITITNKLHGRDITPDMQYNVFLHEVTHLILERMGETKLASNEKLVELFSNCLHQVLNTAKYDNAD